MTERARRRRFASCEIGTSRRQQQAANNATRNGSTVIGPDSALAWLIPRLSWSKHVLRHLSSRRVDVEIAALLAIAATLLYWHTLQPGMVGGDGGEFQFVPAVLGIPHYTGYPLYVLVGKLWIVVTSPFGSVAYRMNLLSAVCAGGAVGWTYLASRELSVSRLASALAVVSLAVTWLLWKWATISGVRAAAVLFAAVILTLGARWLRLARTDAGGRGEERALLLLCLVLGLSLAHHRSTVFWFPALAGAWLVARHKPRAAALARALLLFTLPLLLYLYLPIRAALGTPYDQFHPNTWSGFFELVGALRVSRGLIGIPVVQLPERVALLGQELHAEFGALALAVALLGLAALARRQTASALLAIIFLFELAVQVLLWNIGPNRINAVYLMPGFVVVAVFIAAGYDLIAAAPRIALPRRPAAIVPVLTLLVSAVVVVPAAVAHVRQREIDAARAPGPYRQHLEWGTYPAHFVATSLPYVPPNAIILTDWEQSVLFNYARLVEGIRPGVTVDWGSGDLASIDIRRLLARSNRPIYAVHPVPALTGLHLSADGPLIRASATPLRTLPPFATRKSVSLVDGMAMAGYTLYDDAGRATAAPGPLHTELTLVIYWTCRTTPSGDYAVSVRLLANGKSVKQQDNRHPVYGLSPTNEWPAGEVVGDEYEFGLHGLAPGDYTVTALLYRQVGKHFTNLPTIGPTGQPGPAQFDIAHVVVGR